MAEREIIEESLQRLLFHIENHNYHGYDPYDALKSPIFRLPFLRKNKKLRFVSQQIVKRLPFNVRPILFVPEGYNPVTLGLCIQGYSFLYQISKRTISPSPPLPISSTRILDDPELRLQSEVYLKRIIFLVNELKGLVAPGFHGACWGYDFPWEARHASIPANQPTVVATGIIANSLYVAHKITGIAECALLVKSAADFVLKDLNRNYSGDSFIFSYSPFDRQQVFNASMKGVRLLSQAFSLTGDKDFKIHAKKAVDFVVSNQKDNGSWDYSLSNGGNWTDNYHTGYILDCLDEYSLLCGDRDYDIHLKSGYGFYIDHFIEDNGMPRFYASKAFPADCTAAAQTIHTLVRFGNKKKAMEVAFWMARNMQAEKGSFYFRKHKYYTVKTDFMRWSDAWMFSALARLKHSLEN